MNRKLGIAIATAVALGFATVVAGPSVAKPLPPSAGDQLAVYTGTVDAAGLQAIVGLGVDRQEIVASPDGAGRLSVQVILSGDQAAELSREGADLTPKSTGAQKRSAKAAGPVFRPYSGPGGLQEELATQASAHPTIAELRVIGQTVNGQDISAVRVTRNPATAKDGSRPTTVYFGAQHAREWITPEMVRRLLHLYLDGYGTDPRITTLINTTELWFIPVANPDGYDFTFQDDGDRLWRKNLRDNNGDGAIGSGDGVDLNRNSATRWGYDNEGSSPNPASETYRGPTPASEPETQAMDALFKRLTPQFFINYHSAAELLLHGIGWQVATPSPDDVIYEAMVGDDADPAIPGYDPDISAELYTTNGDIDSHLQEAYGTLGFTPEMSTCETASGANPDDEWLAEDCPSVFNFPDDEALVQAEFEKNVPFALAVAESALDPDDPVSVVGRDAPDFQVDSFTVSYGDPQPVAVVAKKTLTLKRLNYKVNGGPTKTTTVKQWKGGERYGFENDDYYAEYRGLVTGVTPGDSVEVWFSARPALRDIPKQGIRQIQSEHFTYTLAQDTGNDVLVIANEDYTGVNPTYPPGTTAPKYLDQYVDALTANGVTPDVWDVDAQGVPHDLAVLGHHKAILWYLGDNRLTQDPEDELTEVGSSEVPDLSVAERQQYLTIAVRDFLNEGGKLAYTGETAAYYGTLAGTLGGLYYGLNGAPDQPCAVTEDLFSDCLLYADDFTQYYMGAYSRAALAAGGVVGTSAPVTGLQAMFADPATQGNPVDEAGAFTVTSDVLPVSEFPQFQSSSVAGYLDPSGPFIAIDGDWAAGAGHVDDGYQRLARTFDLRSQSAADAPAFEAQFSYATEEGYDHVIVEAHTLGQENWTTLADSNGGTTSALPTECEAGFLVDEHPQLEHYITLGDPCLPTGSTGEWNSFTGFSNGWVPVSFDLSAYTGQQVEVVVSYVTDPGTGENGVIIDDTRLVTVAGPTEAEGFESDLGAWSALGPPTGSPAGTRGFERTPGLGGIVAAVRTPDTVLLGFGLEQLASANARALTMKGLLKDLGR
ncbi:M14 family zinc carboxypeptidase [Glaciibacter sp. 2TAF33]|uniref:M14 family metallopeptidase n=1 Tax=Glaciibacter sp. 2TAF33 TaxID=3233015 RepID=UPI003F90F93B